MKTCPFCAEEIQDAAIKCKHCGEFLDEAHRPIPPKVQPVWYFRSQFIVTAFCCVGPLALPLLWWRPKTSMTAKILISMAVIVITALLIMALIPAVKGIKESFQLLEELY